MSTDCKIVRATARKRYSPILKTNKLPGLQLKKNARKVKVVEKARFDDTISNVSKSSDHSIVESRPLTLGKLQNRAGSESNVMQETHGRKNLDQISHDVRPSCDDDALLRYLHLQRRVLDKDMKTQIPKKTLNASRNPLIFVRQLCGNSQEPQENLLSIHCDRLHEIALTQGVQNKGNLNLQTFMLDFPKHLNWDIDNRSNTSSVIQNPKNNVNQSCQLEVHKSPVNQDHLEVLPIQTTSGQSSKVESAVSKSSYHSKMKSALYSSVTHSNSAEHQDSTIEEMAVDKLSEANCIEQNDFSERKAESESSANPNSLKNANHSGQYVESSVEEESSVVDEVTSKSSDISSMQDVDNDDLINSSETNSEDIFDCSPKSYEEVNQSVDPILNTEDQLLNVFRKMEVDFLQSFQIAHDLHKSLVQSYEVIKSITNASKNYRELKKGKVTIETSKEVTVEVQQMSKEHQAKRKEGEVPDGNMEENNDVESKRNENDDDNVDNDEDIKDVKNRIRYNKVPKTIRSHIRTFVLPPEYDPNDTRWTLKYRENDPELNLVELVPQSNVFIDSIKLAHCKRVAKDGKALARMLLVEVFSQSALSVCSLTGVRATAFDVSGTNVRPGLDENARMAILSFVEEYAFMQTSGAYDTYAVINSLRSKIHDIRVKCDKDNVKRFSR